MEASATHAPSGQSGSAQLSGAIVAAGGGLFLSNRIDDSFAIVNAGAPDIDVMHDNRVVARTNASGKALAPNLRSYQPNRISIDPRNLPVNAVIESTLDVIAPPDRAGVVVDFGVKTTTHSAIVVLTDEAGAPLPVGSSGAIHAGLRGSAPAASFTVGYDGRAFIANLAMDNIVVVTRGDRDCEARFAYAPRGDEQIVIGPVPCR